MNKLDHAESRECLALMKWAGKIRLESGHSLSDVMYHVPNGGKRGMTEAGIMKGEGVKAGQMDYHLPIPRNGFASLYLEMKKPGAVPSEVKQVQRDRTIIMRDCGNTVRFARTWTMAAFIICEYLGLPMPHDPPAAELEWEDRVNALVEKQP